MAPLVHDSYPVNSLARPLFAFPSLAVARALSRYFQCLLACCYHYPLTHFTHISHHFNEARLHFFRGFDYFDGHRLGYLFALPLLCFCFFTPSKTLQLQHRRERQHRFQPQSQSLCFLPLKLVFYSSL